MFEEVFNGFRVTLFKEKIRVTDKVTDNLTENQNWIVRLMIDNPRITTRELADNIHISQRKIKENLSKLKERGIVQRIGAAKGGYWKVMN